MDVFATSFFWVTLGQIMMINIMLSGDNAVVIAMASRALPARQQKQAILFGSFGAIVLRVILTFFAVLLLALPWLKLIGAALLGYIGIKMLVPDDAEAELDGHTQLWAAIKTIIVADFIMSLDNVLGVAAAAKGSLLLLIFGLVLSVPIVIGGSQIIMKLIERFPLLVVAGGGLLGYVAAEMMITDPVVVDRVNAQGAWLQWAAPIAGILLVIGIAQWLKRRQPASAVLEEHHHPGP